jgi:hypothetical protein
VIREFDVITVLQVLSGRAIHPKGFTWDLVSYLHDGSEITPRNMNTWTTIARVRLAAQVPELCGEALTLALSITEANADEVRAEIERRWGGKMYAIRQGGPDV